MKKPFKVLSTASVAAVAATSLAAVAPVSAADTVIDEVTIDIDGETTTESLTNLNHLKLNPDSDDYNKYFNNDGDFKHNIENVKINDDFYKLKEINHQKINNPDGTLDDWVDAADPVTSDVSVDSVSAINTKTIQVDFTNSIDVDEIKRNDVSVTDGDDNQRVKSVKLADDGESAKITLYNALPANATYNVDIDVADNIVSGQLTVGDLEPATIEADAEQTVPAGENTAVKYTIKDADGVDVTEDYNTEDLTFSSAAVNEDGTVELNPDEFVTTTIQYKDDDDKVVAESGKIKLQAEEVKVDKISNWTVVEEGETADFGDDFERSTEAFEGDHLEVSLKDQFGENIDLNETDVYSVEYKSLDKDIAVVDKNTGEFNSIYEGGTVPVQISVKDNEGTEVKNEAIEVEANEAPDFASFDFGDQEPINILTNDEKTIEVDLLDQYGNKYDDMSKSNIDVESNDKNNIDLVKDSKKLSNGTFSFKVKPENNAPKDNYTFTVSAENNNGETVEETIEVKVVEAGMFDHYEVRGLEDTLDLNTESDKDNPSDVSLSVESVDVNGNDTGNGFSNDELTVDIQDEEGKSVESFDDIDSTGNYTVTVSKDGLGDIVRDYEFKVVNTDPEPEYEVNLDEADITVTTSDLSGDAISDKSLYDALNQAYEVTDAGEATDKDIESFNITSFASSELNFDSDAEAEEFDAESTFDLDVEDGDTVSISVGSLKIDDETFNLVENGISDIDVTFEKEAE